MDLKWDETKDIEEEGEEKEEEKEEKEGEGGGEGGEGGGGGKGKGGGGGGGGGGGEEERANGGLLVKELLDVGSALGLLNELQNVQGIDGCVKEDPDIAFPFVGPVS